MFRPNPDKLLLILGPCSLESHELANTVAAELKLIQSAHPDVEIVFKGSFDKANRTSIQSDRGPGIQEGLAIHKSIKDKYGFPCTTDIHTPEQVVQVAEVCDILQVPAFLCRQTDLLVAAAQTGKVVNVKKGQFLSPYEMKYVVDKLNQAGAETILQTERGTTFGYQNLVVDMRSFQIMRANGYPTVMDATHSVQMPGAANGTTSGKREFVPHLAKAAIAAGANGLFLETHPDPRNAISDGPNQVPLEQLAKLIKQFSDVWELINNQETITL